MLGTVGQYFDKFFCKRWTADRAKNLGKKYNRVNEWVNEWVNNEWIIPALNVGANYVHEIVSVQILIDSDW